MLLRLVILNRFWGEEVFVFFVFAFVFWFRRLYGRVIVVFVISFNFCVFWKFN